jgi:hypothetical protein
LDVLQANKNNRRQEKKMAKKIFFFGTLAIGLAFSFAIMGCWSIPTNTERLEDLSSVPQVSSEPTPLEGIWDGELESFLAKVYYEYTFSGNQFTLVFKTREESGRKGVFALVDDTLVLYYLQTWNNDDMAWENLPTSTVYREKITNTWALEGGKLEISDGKYRIIFSKIDTPTMKLLQ